MTRSTEAVTTEDKERIRTLLRSFGALDQDMTYQGSGRAGYSEPPGGGDQAGTRSQPLDLRADPRHRLLAVRRPTSARAGIRRRR